ncbi:membrane protein insertion efficiency factor YidD [Pleomorphomonas oryzae]|uniref:membrane protein insertion efficiency factor YidD n=1 Tax=Pleomorphomonas oryzae TaxID=261934 RepID=UPI0009FEC2CE|nr:membrane protein insertion efficiency factor YidD [Pleomorphomonas oryzae]
MCECGQHVREAGHVHSGGLSRRWTPGRLVGRALIRVYQVVLSPLMGRQCRHLPTCSSYTDEAISRFGLWAGGWMGLARILRCNPWGSSGFDPVPKTLAQGYRWWRPWIGARWTGAHIDPKTKLD